MCKNFMDLEDGNIFTSTSDSTAIDSKGHVIMSIGGGMAMDVDSGDLHIVSSLDGDDD